MSQGHGVMKSERLILGFGVAVLALVAWGLTILNVGPMVGVPGLPIDFTSLSLFVLAWTLSMIAMMFPTAVPMLLMFLHVGRNSSEEIRAGGGPTPAKAVLFVGTYLGAWVGAGVAFYVAAAIVLSQLPISYNLFIGTTLGVGLALILVAAYQLSPVKGECLARCHPNSFIFRYYRGGRFGASRMGLEYAEYCVGCCWVMMIFLMVSAAMGLVWMAAFTAIIFAERNLPLRSWVPKVFGVGFFVAGAALVII
ncbi:MAG: DUF2182 domain-containing protein [Thaumarchaeota archaeon]|nr:DUF2182 domain-containing protein [Nitrososphaerota archaeon]